jgi:hypothetical protein
MTARRKRKPTGSWHYLVDKGADAAGKESRNLIALLEITLREVKAGRQKIRSVRVIYEDWRTPEQVERARKRWERDARKRREAAATKLEAGDA